MSTAANDSIYKIFQLTKKALTHRHCKVITTLGPASTEYNIILEIIKTGADVIRLNFSHGSHSEHSILIQRIRRASLEAKRNVAILQDLQGPKIRCGKLNNSQLLVKKGQIYKLCYQDKQDADDIIPIDFKTLAKDVKVGEPVLMDDGLLSFIVVDKKKSFVYIKSLSDGLLKNRKGINFPESKLSTKALTEKDSQDLLFGVSQGVDAVALSFVQKPEDVLSCRKLLKIVNSDIPIISKIEKKSAIEYIEEIADVSDGLMIARGDLGVEGSIEKVPVYQKQIVNVANKKGIPVIVATQMLDSMIKNPRPTFAEITDVANGVLEGVDAVMLSGEVAIGKYPIRCIENMISIIEIIEKSFQIKTKKNISINSPSWENHTAIAKTACETAQTLNAKLIVCLTLTGSIAKIISSWRPKATILAISPRANVIQNLCFYWGVHGIRNPLFYATDSLLQDIPNLLKTIGIVEKNDTIIITAGIPLKDMCPTNMIKINKIS
jgi:pyruvate kinase